MQIKKKMMYSGVVSLSALVASIFTPIVPCTTIPNIPNAIPKWKLCSLNPDKISSLGSITEYLGYTSSLRETYILVLGIIFTLSMIFFHYTSKKSK